MTGWGSSRPVWDLVRSALDQLVVVLQVVDVLDLGWSCESIFSVSSPQLSWKAVPKVLTWQRLT
jgi:hypothetical protein